MSGFSMKQRLLLLALPWLAPCFAAWAQDPASRRIELSSEQEVRAGIQTVTALQASSPGTTRVVGVAVRAPSATTLVRAPAGGPVEELYVAPGQVVRKGELLMTLHSHEIHHLAVELRLAERRVAVAENLHLAGRELYAIEGISRLELERREHEALGALLELEAIKVELEDMGMVEDEIEALTVGELHGELPVRAPVSGVVLEVHVTAQFRAQAWESLALLGHSRDLELDLQVPPSMAPSVMRDQKIQFAPVGEPLCCVATVLTQVPQVDETTRTVRIRARVESSSPMLVPGVFVEGELVAATEPGEAPRVAVVEDAVIRLEGRDVVFVEVGSGSYQPVAIEVGRTHGGKIEVLSGLGGGERIVSSGAFLLKSMWLRAEGSAQE